MKKAWSDCPPCPKCRATCGTRAGGSEMAAYARRLGERFLSCAACGHVWDEPSDEALAKAARADAAWEAEQTREAAAFREQLRAGTLPPGTYGQMRPDGSVKVTHVERDGEE